MDDISELSERDKSAMSAFLEEYKTKTSQVMALDGEIHRWSASYMVALIVGIGWSLGNSRFDSWSSLFLKYDSHVDFKSSYLILSVAIINALYILWLTIKGYQAQQIHYYLYSVVGKEITKISTRAFNTFEIWRRSQPFCGEARLGATDWRRTFFYTTVTILPFGISATILGLYARFVWPGGSPNLAETELWNYRFLNVYFLFVIALHCAVGAVAISTALFDRLWRQAAREAHADRSKPVDVQSATVEESAL